MSQSIVRIGGIYHWGKRSVPRNTSSHGHTSPSAVTLTKGEMAFSQSSATTHMMPPSKQLLGPALDTMPGGSDGLPASMATPPFGGRYVPEVLFEALDRVETAFQHCVQDPTFWSELTEHYRAMGGPTPLRPAPSLNQGGDGARMFLKCSGHAITNAVGQALLARRLGRTQVIAETGSGSHGVAVAAICQHLRLPCVVYMGSRDVQRLPNQRRRIEALGATVVEASAGAGTLREATNDALRALITTENGAYLLVGGPNGPEPYPTIVRTFQAFAGWEMRRDIERLTGQPPHAVVASAGAHGSAVGMFSPFVNDLRITLVAVEGGGRGTAPGQHAAVLTSGTPGVFRGAYTLVLQNEEGQIVESASDAADFNDPVASPQLATWTRESRIRAVAITDIEAAHGRELLRLVKDSEYSSEDEHVVAAALSLAHGMLRSSNVVVCVGAEMMDWDASPVLEVCPKTPQFSR